MTITARLSARAAGIATVCLTIAGVVAPAQTPVSPSPFLFAAFPLVGQSRVVTAVDGGYNIRAFEPVAGERLEPKASALVSVSSLFAVRGELGGAGTPDHRTRIGGQVEGMLTPFRFNMLALGASVGVRHEYSGANVGLARLAAARTTKQLALAADVLVEHAYARGRDPVDVVTTVGASRALARSVWVGVEAVGSDLEGLFGDVEAEGGATVLVGPSIAVALSERCRLVVGGGPVIRASSNSEPGAFSGAASPPGTQRSGYVMRTSLRLAW